MDKHEPIVEQYKIKSTTKKEQSSRITFLDLNLFNYSFFVQQSRPLDG